MRTFLKWSVVVFVAGLSAMNCFAQGTNGKITGTVKDASGGVIASATVTATRVDTNEQQTAQTDSSGNFSLLALQPAVYDLEVRTEGFNIYRQKGIKVDVNSALQINVVMTVGTTATTVEVAAEAVHVETTNTQVGDVVGGTVMQNMPLNGRDFTNLMPLQAGINPVSTTTQNGEGANAEGGAATGNYSVNGHEQDSNGFFVNGGNIEQTRFNGAALIPNMDSIDEFRVITSNVDAEYGDYAGGIISLVTKSGTNAFHGSAFEYLRNTSLDAKNFFDSTRGPFRRNQFGGTVGGPIKHDKLFFFSDFQATRQTQEISQGEVPVPTQAEQNGDFSAPDISSQLAGTAVRGPYFANILSQRLGYTVTANEPYYAPGCASSGPNPCVFPGAIIPKAAWDPAATKILALPGFFPLPTTTTPTGSGFFVGSGSLGDNVVTNTYQGSARIDYENKKLGRVSFYYADSHLSSLNPYGADQLPGTPTTDTVFPQQFDFWITKTFGNTAVNEFRFNFLRSRSWVQAPLSFGVPLTQLGFVYGPSLTTGGGIVTADPKDAGTPNFHFNSFSVGVPDFDYQQFQSSPQVVDNFSKIVGRHTLKFGAEWDYTRYIQNFPASNPNGTFSPDGSETGLDFADFLVGVVGGGGLVQSSDIHYDNRKTYVGLYAEDSWRVRSNLTVNYGLRWDHIQNWWEANNATSDNWIPGQQSKVFPTAPLGENFAGDPSPLGGTIPGTVARTPKKDFSPRIGIAYSPSADSGPLKWFFGSAGKTSIRAAYGIFYSNNEGRQAWAITGAAPWVAVYTSSVPALLFEPYRNSVDGFVNPSPPFPNYIPAGPGTTTYQACPTCPVGPINWEIPLSGLPTWSLHNRTPYAEDFSLTFQRQLPRATVVSIGYVGTEGHHILAGLQSNIGSPALCNLLNAQNASPSCGPNGENVVYSVPAGPTQTLCPGPITNPACTINGTYSPLGNNFTGNTVYTSVGNTNYHALQVSVQHTSASLSLLAAYTWSRAENDTTYEDGTVNPFNAGLSRQLASFNVPQDFTFSYNYNLPFGRLSDHHDRLLKGWQLAGIATFAKGTPILMRQTGDRSELGLSGSPATPIYDGQPLNIIDPRKQDPANGVFYFNVADFKKTAIGAPLNTLNRRFFSGPGLNNFDMSLIKDTAITERTKVQFRAEFFNVFNHAQFFCSPPGCTAGTNPGSSAFGLITQARDPRIGQLALKFLF
jgi:hypothetical protein